MDNIACYFDMEPSYSLLQICLDHFAISSNEMLNQHKCAILLSGLDVDKEGDPSSTLYSPLRGLVSTLRLMTQSMICAQAS